VNQKIFTIFITLFITLFFLQGCNKKSEKLDVGVHQWIGYHSLYIANDLNYLQKSVTLHKERDPLERIRKLKDGTIQVATFTLDEVLLAREQGVPLQVVMFFDISAGGDSVISCKNLEKLSDIKGERIAFEETTISRVMLASLLESANVKEDEISLLSIPQAKQEEGYKENKSDIFITYEPFATQLRSLGGKVIFDSREIPNTIVDVLAINTDTIHGKEESLKKLIAAHFKTLNHLTTNYDDYMYRIAHYEQSSFADSKKAFNGIRMPFLQENYQLLKNPQLLQKTLTQLNQILIQQKILKESQKFDALLSAEYLPDEER